MVEERNASTKGYRVGNRTSSATKEISINVIGQTIIAWSMESTAMLPGERNQNGGMALRHQVVGDLANALRLISAAKCETSASFLNKLHRG